MVEVVGFGLAGACVALQLQRAGVSVRVVDDGLGGSTEVAAGLVNPVAGRNFEPSWEVAEAWEIARAFYDDLDPDLFHEVPILRLWRDEKDRAKFERKRDLLGRWISEVTDEGVLWGGGGWLDCRRFLAQARVRFLESGGVFLDEANGGKQIWCTGARGLVRSEFSGVEHRCAKGEILTVRVQGWGEKRILNRNGWLIPLGEDVYRVGATFAWDELWDGPTVDGRAKVEKILASFTNREYEVLDHVAGVRPIIQRSRPVVKFEEGRGWMVNGLGSKGVIYAPRVGAEMVDVTAN